MLPKPLTPRSFSPQGTDCILSTMPLCPCFFLSLAAALDGTSSTSANAAMSDIPIFITPPFGLVQRDVPPYAIVKRKSRIGGRRRVPQFSSVPAPLLFRLGLQLRIQDRAGRRCHRRDHALRVRRQLLLHFWMGLQIVLKLRVVRQRRILGELLRKRRMPAQKLAEAGQVIPVPVVKGRRTIARILALVEASFLTHKTVWIFAKLLPNFRVSLQKLLQGRMILDKLLVFD